MTQILTTILIIIAFVMTLGICIKQPKMHSRVIVFDSSYQIVEEKNNQEEIAEVVEETIPQKVIEEPKAQTVKVQVQEVKNNKVEEKKTVVKNEVPKITKTVQTKTQTKPVPEVIVKTQTPKTTPQTVEKKEVQTPNVQTVKTEVPKQKVETTQTLTEQQEIIAWNKWHSDIQNRLMRDVKLPILPNGTVFVFTFNVDKYGKITNIQTMSTNPKYTPYAIEYIAPVIRSYQGKAIVEFPKGSKREVTTFKGGWKLSNQAKYSRPEDYNDSEVIRK